MPPLEHIFDNVGDGARIIIVLIFALSGLGGAALKIIGRKIDRAADRADRAAKLAEPTGNGYAARTESALSRLEAAFADLALDVRDHARRIAHLEDPK